MSRYWIGTSGWNYSHWRNRFYPQDLPSSEWLAFYAERFTTVELNYSFYREPSEKSWRLWRETAPPGFCFAVKAHRYLTHRQRLHDPERSLERVVKNACLLGGDQLGPILYQMPPNFQRNRETAPRLEHFLSILPPGMKHAFEFRHESWFGKNTLEQLRRQRAGFCSFDRVGLDCPLVATAPFAYIRFHGSEPQYGGKYTDEALQEWATNIRRLAAEVDDVYIYFNNDPNAYAVDNALTLSRMLQAPITAGLIQ